VTTEQDLHLAELLLAERAEIVDTG